MHSASSRKTGSHPASTPLALRRLFFQSNDRLTAQLLTALTANDIVTARSLAHALTGAALFAGFPALAKTAAEAEANLRACRLAAAAAAISRARRMLHTLGIPAFAKHHSTCASGLRNGERNA